MAELPVDANWPQRFEAKHGRPLRVLHVGNIANNAFLNAKFLRRAGVDADVLCYDYYHVMACPEWEEVDINGSYGDDYSPVFTEECVGAYQRPDWFIQAPLTICAEIVERRYGRANGFASRFKRRMAQMASRVLARNPNSKWRKAFSYFILDPRLFAAAVVRRVLWAASQRTRSRAVIFVDRVLSVLSFSKTTKYLSEKRKKALRGRFGQAYPSRADQLQDDDFRIYEAGISLFQRIYRHYDIVQCYATDPLYGALCASRPYVAFEHGTLRDFTQGDQPLHRLTALGYLQAAHTFVTNGDCLEYAKRLELPSFGPAIHPIDVEQHRADHGLSPADMKASYGADLLLFCPLRHDWAVKGTDIHLRALPLIKERFAGRVVLILVDWGKEMEESRALLEELGCDKDVRWMGSLCRIAMIRFLQAADVVLDQMALPHFGATAPQSLAAGTPVISSYDPASTRWLVPEPAPILPAFGPQGVADGVMTALDPAWRSAFQKQARRWVDLYHSPDRVIDDHLRVYRKVLGL